MNPTETGERTMVEKERYLRVSSRGEALKEDPALNKGTCFTREEREEFGLLGLLPPGVSTREEQAARAYGNYREAGDDVHRYLFLASLQDPPSIRST
jgi:malate dehydrogenase (oxaloacetate-decarboxylating)